MLRLNEQVHVLQLPMNVMGQQSIIHPILILDEKQGATLVDTGVPGLKDKIAAELAASAIQLSEVKQVILTHQDLDHMGSLAAVLQQSHAKVLAHRAEVPYIQGEIRPIKFPTEQMMQDIPGLRNAIDHFVFSKVDQVLEDGDVLDFAGGIQVVFTPGHTPGHISLYLQQHKILITGDATAAENGILVLPMKRVTPNYPEALASLRKLAELDVETIVCYHGGVVSDQASDQLKRLAESTLTLDH